MKKEFLIAILCTGLMLATPFSAVAKENTMGGTLSELPDDVVGLVAQLRVVVNNILQNYGHIPMVSYFCNVIIDLLGLVGKILFCIALLILEVPLLILLLLLGTLGLYYIFQAFAILTYLIINMFDRECSPYLPHPITSTILKINDISDIDCPCLQE